MRRQPHGRHDDDRREHEIGGTDRVAIEQIARTRDRAGRDQRYGLRTRRGDQRDERVGHADQPRVTAEITAQEDALVQSLVVAALEATDQVHRQLQPRGDIGLGPTDLLARSAQPFSQRHIRLDGFSRHGNRLARGLRVLFVRFAGLYGSHDMHSSGQWQHQLAAAFLVRSTGFAHVVRMLVRCRFHPYVGGRGWAAVVRIHD